MDIFYHQRSHPSETGAGTGRGRVRCTCLLHGSSREAALCSADAIAGLLGSFLHHAADGTLDSALLMSWGNKLLVTEKSVLQAEKNSV